MVRPRYEFQIFSFEGGMPTQARLDQLNNLGGVGWSVAGAFGEGTEYYPWVLLSRPLPETEETRTQ